MWRSADGQLVLDCAVGLRFGNLERGAGNVRGGAREGVSGRGRERRGYWQGGRDERRGLDLVAVWTLHRYVRAALFLNSAWLGRAVQRSVLIGVMVHGSWRERGVCVVAYLL